MEVKAFDSVPSDMRKLFVQLPACAAMDLVMGTSEVQLSVEDEVKPT